MSKRKFTATLGAASLSLLGAFAPVSISLNSQSQAFLPVVIGDASAHAQLGNYVPPNGRGRMQRTEGSGARGCTNSIPVTLNLLTPSDHTARTTEARPTFLWHISNATTAPMVFTLTAPGQNQPIYQKRLKADKAGIMKLELPELAPELGVGKEYRWTVAIVCNDKRPSQNINARAWIERVATTPQLKQKLAGARNDNERALAYTQEGIWYDGMSILNNLQSSRSNPKATELFTSLLKQVGLNKIATAGNQRPTN
ncbi:hypothetical protein NIES4071_87520 [Calothrix sp. NIES-4071]|nr:hypothetical protein NIES4071_87520 [Calothrix sp. NIES-4071]BAZ63019.1 hypothetical protein NIES4105_87450 [Calothrix sp. NIES-4105]